MKGLVRGGILASILSLAAVLFIYAQTTTVKDDLVIADGMNSQAVAQNIVETDNSLVEAFNTQAIDTSDVTVNNDDDDDKKLVKKTGMSSAAGAGRGAAA